MKILDSLKSHFLYKHKCFIVVLICTFISTINTYASVTPKWLTSPYFRANSQNIINTFTGNNTIPTYTFTFSSALSGVPNLAYGVKNYRGKSIIMLILGIDTMGNQMFQIRRVFLTNSAFKVSIQIFGYTTIYLLGVGYLAIDPEFPHHLNSFDNVPINYTNGQLVNLTKKITSVITQTNSINYTFQSSGNQYTSFKSPISNNKIVLFICSLYILASQQPLKLSIDYQILNQSFYKWTVTLDRKAYIDRLHFSQIVYDEADVISSKTYAIVYEEWIVDANGGYKEFPFELKDNMILAITDFQSIKGYCGFQYNWEFVQNQGGIQQGIRINSSNPSNINCGLSEARSILFYIKTWNCLTPNIYFNLSSNQCQDGCAGYFFGNETSKQCLTCHYTCIQCGSEQNPLDCDSCETGTYRILVNKSCICDEGYFDDGYSPHCKKCSDPVEHCSKCQFVIDPIKPNQLYSDLFTSATWQSDILTSSFSFNCQKCELPYYINTTSRSCELCQLRYCQICKDLNACSVCDQNQSIILSSADSLCYICTIDDCIECSSDDFCSICKQGFSLFNGTCIFEESQMLIDQQNTLAFALAIFTIGCLRIVGIEMLFVFQNIQLTIKTLQLEHYTHMKEQGKPQYLAKEPQILLGISSQIHGYDDYSAFPIKSDYFSSKHLFASFNLMFIIILAMLSIGLFCKCIAILSIKYNQLRSRHKVANSNSQKIQQRDTDLSSEEHMNKYDKKKLEKGSNQRGSNIKSKSDFQYFQTHFENTTNTTSPSKRFVLTAVTYTKKHIPNEQRYSDDQILQKDTNLAKSSNSGRIITCLSKVFERLYFLITKQFLFNVMINCMSFIIYWISQCLFSSKKGKEQNSIYGVQESLFDDLPTVLVSSGFSMIFIILLVGLCCCYSKSNNKKKYQIKDQQTRQDRVKNSTLCSLTADHHESRGFGQNILKFASCFHPSNQKKKKLIQNSTLQSQQSIIKIKFPRKFSKSNNLSSQTNSTIYRHQLFWGFAFGQRLIYSVLLGACPNTIGFETAVFCIIGIKFLMITILIGYWTVKSCKKKDQVSRGSRKSKKRKYQKYEGKQEEINNSTSNSHQQFVSSSPPLFCHPIQQIRSIIIQIFHLALLSCLLFRVQIKELIFEDSGREQIVRNGQEKAGKYMIEQVLLSVLALVTAISFVFYIREAMYCFQADYCRNNPFDVKNDDSQENLDKKIEDQSAKSIIKDCKISGNQAFASNWEDLSGDFQVCFKNRSIPHQQQTFRGANGIQNNKRSRQQAKNVFSADIFIQQLKKENNNKQQLEKSKANNKQNKHKQQLIKKRKSHQKKQRKKRTNIVKDNPIIQQKEEQISSINSSQYRIK